MRGRPPSAAKVYAKPRRLSSHRAIVDQRHRAAGQIGTKILTMSTIAAGTRRVIRPRFHLVGWNEAGAASSDSVKPSPDPVT